MTDAEAKQSLDIFVSAVAGMRQHQRDFFKAPAGSPERHQALMSSKQAEKRVDDMIKIMRDGREPNPQGRLFG